MILTKITRTYSKSINARNYGAPESWIKVEAVYEAQVESNDDSVEVSKLLFECAKQDVVKETNDLIQKISEGAAAARTAKAFTPMTPPRTTAPVNVAAVVPVVTAPTAPVAGVNAPQSPAMKEAAPEPLHEVYRSPAPVQPVAPASVNPPAMTPPTMTAPAIPPGGIDLSKDPVQKTDWRGASNTNPSQTPGYPPRI